MILCRVSLRRTPKHDARSSGIVSRLCFPALLLDIRMLVLIDRWLVPITPAREVFHALPLRCQIHSTRECDGVHGSPSLAHTGIRPVSLGARREQSRTNVHWAI